MTRTTRPAVLAALLAFAAGSAQAEPRLLWGDTHVHTSWSIDAFATGNHLAGPDEAFRFAKGEPILHPRLRTRLRIDRPLDFLVVADHAEHLRWQVATLEGNPLLEGVPGFEAARALVRDEPRRSFWLGPVPLTPEYYAAVLSPGFRADAWQRQVDAAEAHNEPGVFTTLAGWEWSSRGGGSNLHRVVFSPSGPEALRQFMPFSNAESEDPEDLWRWLEATAQATGAEFVAIPHNSNLSAGYMFTTTTFDGRPIDADYARQRMRWEPVMEITQVKGTSETHPALSPNDEFADFEIFEQLLGPGTFEPLRADYARTALLTGLAIGEGVGFNPYRFGVIGSSDSHTGFSSVQESDFHGKVISHSLPDERLDSEGQFFKGWEMSASGLAAVWAAENTRDAITAAFRRREVYATSGPRILLRVFGWIGFVGADAESRDLAAIAAAGGVPMGGELAGDGGRRALQLLIQAAMDPQGANLDRLQVVKGWLDEQGAGQERIYDVAWSGGRVADAQGRVGPVGNSVDVTAAKYANSIGAAQLATLWTDPDFNPRQRAFYYVRVLEIPTPRHSTFDAVALGVDVSRTGMPETIQERAWSSPIWYAPDG